MKKLWVVLCVVLVLTACTSEPTSLSTPETTLVPAIAEDLAEVEEELTQLAEINLKWLSERTGWLHYVVTPDDVGDPLFRFTSQDCWYQMDKGRVVEGIQTVVSPASGEEVQRYVINADGYRGELLELRKNGLDALSHAIPYEANWEAANISWSYMDTMILQGMKQFIVEIEALDEVCEGELCIRIRVRFEGDPDLRALGLPPGYGKIGKEENYYYSLSTGNRLSYSRAFINEDGTIDTATSFSERWAWVDSPGQETLDSLETGLEELDFYIQLFSQE
ncbi:MAG: hypothetical protein WA116_08125 [Anaerolineaceae bacterium]